MGIMPISDCNVKAEMKTDFQVKMIEAPTHAPCTFCYACCCQPCMATQQRLTVMEITNEKYVLCGGICPMTMCRKPCKSSTPWLCLETFCCTCFAIGGTRYLIQTRFERKND